MGGHSTRSWPGLACGGGCGARGAGATPPALPPLQRGNPQERFKWTEKSAAHAPQPGAKPAPAPRAKAGKGEGKAATAGDAAAAGGDGSGEAKPGGKRGRPPKARAAAAAEDEEAEEEEGKEGEEGGERAHDPARRGLGPSLVVRPAPAAAAAAAAACCCRRCCCRCMLLPLLLLPLHAAAATAATAAAAACRCCCRCMPPPTAAAAAAAAGMAGLAVGCWACWRLLTHQPRSPPESHPSGPLRALQPPSVRPPMCPPCAPPTSPLQGVKVRVWYPQERRWRKGASTSYARRWAAAGGCCSREAAKAAFRGLLRSSRAAGRRQGTWAAALRERGCRPIPAPCGTRPSPAHPPPPLPSSHPGPLARRKHSFLFDDGSRATLDLLEHKFEVLDQEAADKLAAMQARGGGTAAAEAEAEAEAEAGAAPPAKQARRGKRAAGEGEAGEAAAAAAAPKPRGRPPKAKPAEQQEQQQQQPKEEPQEAAAAEEAPAKGGRGGKGKARAAAGAKGARAGKPAEQPAAAEPQSDEAVAAAVAAAAVARVVAAHSPPAAAAAAGAAAAAEPAAGPAAAAVPTVLDGPPTTQQLAAAAGMLPSYYTKAEVDAAKEEGRLLLGCGSCRMATHGCKRCRPKLVAALVRARLPGAAWAAGLQGACLPACRLPAACRLFGLEHTAPGPHSAAMPTLRCTGARCTAHPPSLPPIPPRDPCPASAGGGGRQRRAAGPAGRVRALR